MRAEPTGPVLEFDSHTLLAVTGVPVSNAIWKSRTNLFDSKLELLGDLRKQEHDAELVLWSVLQRSTPER
jgi:hypothetical protein